MVLDLVFCGRVDGKQQQIEILGTEADLWDQNQPIETHSDESCGFYEDKYTSVCDLYISCLLVWLQML